MSIKRTLIKGTFFLTAAGMISRLIGFYYRIFLNNTIGAEGVGIYQLIFPVHALCFSLTSAGIQTTISRLVAANDTPTGQKNQITVFRLGLFTSCFLALFSALFLYWKADWIAVHFIMEERCASLLRIMAVAIPLCAVHSAIFGYYYGIKNASIPSITQLGEQIVRVLGMYLLVHIYTSRHILITAEIAVWGLILGEAASTLISVTALKYHLDKKRTSKEFCNQKKAPKGPLFSLLIRQSVPLTMNRLVINLLQSIEAVLIPTMLKAYGMKTAAALSTYGILTGMALPLVLFPSALTNSVSVMLLPAIAQAQADHQEHSIRHAIGASIKYCMLLGVYCTGIFLVLGKEMGMVLFHNAEAGKFIVTLAWICPFLYLTTTLGSIVHGLGKTFLYFIYNSISLLIRIAFVAVSIPKIGILGYLWGVLASQLVLTLLLLYCLSRECHIHFQLAEHIVIPLLYITVSTTIYRFVRPLLQHSSLPGIFTLCIGGMIITAIYGGLAIYYGSIPFGKKKAKA